MGGIVRTWLPVVLGFGLIGVGVAPEILPMGGEPGLGDLQVQMILVGALMTLCRLLLRGSRAPGFGDFVLAAGAAAIGTAPGLAAKGEFWLAIGAGLVLGATLAPAVAAGRWRREVMASGSLSMRNIGWAVLAAAQAMLAALIVRQYHLENEALYQSTIVIALAGFVINLLLPRSIRLIFFVFLSMGAFVAILGFPIFGALLIPSAILIGVCWLPLPMRVRVWLLLLIAVVLAYLRVSPFAAILPGAVWPLLGSIFMFRLIVYVYDMAHAKAKPTLSSTLAYFFMLPNVVFPFFPVIDYTMFRRGYHDTDERKIHQDGAVFLFWGVLHLILYRVVNYYWLIGSDQVTTTASLARYVVSNYLLYLRVSGQFHLIIGILHLFGFHLPRTNNRYFLASSFTDLWRRINIYWKDFMLKVFYWPIFFRLKKLGETKALVLSTILVFLLTWFFHAYQWFWLRGTFLLTGPDMLFWAVLGVLVVVNSLIELKAGRKRTLGQARLTPAEWGARVARTSGTFFVMATLWSLWSAASAGEWLRLWAVVPKSMGLMAGLLVAASGLMVAGVRFGALRKSDEGGSAPPRKLGVRPAGPVLQLGPSLAILAALLGVYVIGIPKVSGRLGADVARVLRDLRWSRLSDADQAKKERGYYENLNAVNGFNSQLWELYMRRPVYQEIWNTDAVRNTGDFLVNELNPDVSIVFRGAPYRTNRWAMRDQDYEKERAPGTFRMALLGDSHTEGWGVGNEENFDHRLEERLNADRPFPRFEKIELLNFAVGGYLPPQMLLTLERKVLDFSPQAVMLVAHPGDGVRVLYHLARGVIEHVPNPYPDLDEFTKRSGITDTMTQHEAVKRMASYADTTLSIVYRRMVIACREKGIMPVWVYLPAVPGRADPGDRGPMRAMAEQAGFLTLDLADVFDGFEEDRIRIGAWDQHPNRFGHILMAERLRQELLRRPEIFGVAGGDSLSAH